MLRWLACMLLVVATLQGHAADAAAALAGHVDALRYEHASQRVHVEGWAWDSAQGQPATGLRVAVGGDQYDISPLGQVARTDVQAALGASAGLAGFSASVQLPGPLPEGEQAVLVTALWPGGGELALPAGQAGTLHVEAAQTPVRHWVLLSLVAAWLALGCWARVACFAQRMGSRWTVRPRHIALALAALFGALVAGGVTGSSWPLLAQGPEASLVQFGGSDAHVLAPRYIRADEWGILATNALSQWSHQPPFPVVNTLLGLEGQNMGVIGMTGTPIAQPAALARPATWGYFFLPLRQAMAWQWQFPFFACLLALWAALSLWLPRRPWLALALSASFCAAPYAAGWSLWPLYAAFFPVALLVAFAAFVQTTRPIMAGPLGAAMGLLLAGWVLVLYPPWQVTVGTFVALLGLGWAADHRDRLRWGRAQWLGLGMTLAIAGVVLGSWWLDTGDAVARMASTAYPGGRTAQQGAGIVDVPWWTLRGYLNAEALPQGLGPQAQKLVPSLHLNESEISSYALLPVPLLLLTAWLGMRRSPQRWALRACLVFAAFWLVFRYAGVPMWLARLTLWSHVTTVRLDLALGLACTVALALAAAAWPAPKPGRAGPWPMGLGTAGVVALASAALVWWEFRWLPQGVLAVASAPLHWAVAFAVGGAAWWLMRGRVAAAVSLVLLLHLAASLPFNPLSRAPRSVELSPEVGALATEHGQAQRTLALGSDAKAAVTLAAAGVPMVNGVLYYPHPTLWQRMGLSVDDWNEVNRYQHLVFALAPLPPAGPAFVARGDMDFVRVTLDPLRFDFATTGATRVAAPMQAAQQLRGNTSLRELGHHGGYLWFAVVQR